MTLELFMNAFSFPIELFTCGLIFMYKRIRLKYNFIRVFSVGLILLFFAYAFYKASFDYFFAPIRYLAFFFVFVISSVFIWGQMPKAGIFYCVASYAIQHLCFSFKLFLSFLFDFKYDTGVVFTLSLISMIIISAIFSNSITDESPSLKSYSMLFVALLMLFVATVLSYVPYALLSPENKITFIVCNLYDVLCCFLILLTEFGLLQNERLYSETAFLKKMRALDEKQYEIIESSMDIINTKNHDLKKQLRIIKSLPTSESLAEIEKAVGDYDCIAQTGNHEVNVILTQELMLAKNNNISIDYHVNGKAFNSIDPMDIYCILGNIVDNAIEAVCNLECSEDKTVFLSADNKQGMLVIKCENKYNGQLSFSKSLPVTTKTDKTMHGFGLKSVKNVVSKYQGNMLIDSDDSYFKVTLVIPI